MSEKKAKANKKTEELQKEVADLEAITNTIAKISATFNKIFPIDKEFAISGVVKEASISLKNSHVVIDKYISYLFSLLFSPARINIHAVKSYLDQLLFIKELGMLQVTELEVHEKIPLILTMSFMMQLYHNEHNGITIELVKRVYNINGLKKGDKTKEEYLQIYKNYYPEETATQIAEYVSRHNETLKQYYMKDNDVKEPAENK